MWLKFLYVNIAYFKINYTNFISVSRTFWWNAATVYCVNRHVLSHIFLSYEERHFFQIDIIIVLSRVSYYYKVSDFYQIETLDLPFLFVTIQDPRSKHTLKYSICILTRNLWFFISLYPVHTKTANNQCTFSDKQMYKTNQNKLF